ncbi:hypothetical protein Tco_0468186 [Tanacetum coccineum]
MDNPIKPLRSYLKNVASIDGNILGRDGKPLKVVKPVRGVPVGAEDVPKVHNPKGVSGTDVGMNYKKDDITDVHGCSLEKNKESLDSGIVKSSFASIL